MRFWIAVLFLLSATTMTAAQTNYTERERAFLDEHYPFIDPNGPKPGGWVKGDATGRIIIVDRGYHWQGQSGWRTRHGEAVVMWQTGSPLRVYNALFSDGSRGDVGSTLDHGFRRPSKGAKLWIYGKIDIQPSDVRFVDGEQPTYTPPPLKDEPNLEAEIARDADFLAALKDERFARAMYLTFQNGTFYKGADERPWGSGIRQAAHLVAALRGMGESYHDYYLKESDEEYFEGIYPDHRAGVEARLRSEVERYSKPHEFSYPSLPFFYNSRRIETQDQLDALRREDEKRRPAIEADRASYLALFTSRLAKLDRNLDIWRSLHGHLTRLGWRIENDGDREREHDKIEAAGVIKLREFLVGKAALRSEIELIGRRPEGRIPDWAEAFQDEFNPGIRSYPVGIWRGPAGYKRLSDEERRLFHVDIASLLRFHAVKGRLEKAEFDALMQRAMARN